MAHFRKVIRSWCIKLPIKSVVCKYLLSYQVLDAFTFPYISLICYLAKAKASIEAFFFFARQYLNIMSDITKNK